ncbi:MAG: alanine racemase [Clostridiaceae bacterium]|nr:alanine racemase [Clostridiaceae bacterium]
MTKYLKRAWAEINLNYLAHNMQEIRRITSKNAEIMAVVKADAYGHGAIQVSKTLLANGADRLAVAFLDEAIQLRNAGIDASILILGSTPEQWVEQLIDNDIVATVYNYSLSSAISNAAIKKNKTARIHIKIDTGMTRLGFKCGESSIKTIMDISRLPGLEIEGIFTHFASADEADTKFTWEQFQRFMYICNKLEEKGLHIPIKHVCNSAAILRFPEMHLNMVRPGIVLYGLQPSNEMDMSKIQLKPVMQVKTVITHLKEVEKGTPVSYGRVYTTSQNSLIATVPIGYGDGYSRVLTGKANMIVRGKKVPVVGRICMDQCMIDVTGVEGVSIGDEVIVFGDSNGCSISADDIAEQMGTINYEVVCAVGKRIPRVYMENDEAVRVLNYLL